MILKKRKVGLALAVVIGLCFVGQVQSAVNVEVDNVLFTHNLKYHGVNWVGFWFPHADTSAACREAMDSMGVQIIRFPGGNPGENYAWKTPPAGVVGPLNVWNFAKSLSSKPQVMFQSNVAGNNNTSAATTGAYAADLVTYAHDNNMDNIFWEIGNEPELQMAGASTVAKANAYYPVFIRQADSIHARVPGSKVAGPAFANDYFWGSGGGQLNLLQSFITNCDNKVDYITLHWYDQPGSPAGYGELKIEASKWTALWAMIRSKTQKPVYMTEWSILGPGMEHVGNDWNKTIGAAMSYADVIGTFCKLGVAGHTMFGCIYAVEGNWGLLYTGEDGMREPNTPSPSFYALATWCKMGNIVVKNSAVNSGGYAVYTHKKANGSVQVMCINKAGTVKSESITFTGSFDPTGKYVNIYEIKPYNTADGRDSAAWDISYNNVIVPPKTFHGATSFSKPITTTCAGTTFTRDLPAYSITMMDFGPANVGIRSPVGNTKTNDNIKVSAMRLAGAKVAISIPLEIARQNPSVDIYAISGELLAKLDGSEPQGNPGSYVWDAAGYTVGSYCVRVLAGDKDYSAKFVLAE